MFNLSIITQILKYCLYSSTFLSYISLIYIIGFRIVWDFNSFYFVIFRFSDQFIMSFLKKSLAILIIVICLGAIHSHAQTPEPKVGLALTIDSILKSQVNTNKIPGAVIEVKIGDEVIMRQAYGYAQKYDYE